MGAASKPFSYDASYVAVAELAQAPWVTLDRRIARAPNLRCAVKVPKGI